jgi:hypothetical protein
MKEITLQEAALAWAQGKRVEAGSTGGDGWMLIDPVGECRRDTHSQSVFGCRNEYRFRLAPEPPAKRYRPWTPEEVPVDAWFKGENGIGFKLSYADLWSGSRQPTVANGSGSHQSLGDVLKIWTHSTDGGKTWSVCGVEVEA